MLLFKPLEWAFDTSRLYFEDDALGNYCMRLLDPSLASMDLVDCWQERERERLEKFPQVGVVDNNAQLTPPWSSSSSVTRGEVFLQFFI